MFGHVNTNEAGDLTGKEIGYGGSLGWKEATGYEMVYFVEGCLKARGPLRKKEHKNFNVSYE